MEVNTSQSQWTHEHVIDMVRKLRNDLIKDFLDERHLKLYIADHFGVRDLNAIKIEFIKRDLKDLLISPVDLEHYASIINQIKLTDSASITEVNEPLFYKEVEVIFKRYMY